MNQIKIYIKSNTKEGFEEACEGDSINFSMPNSKTRRGRVGVGVAQTLDTQFNQGVIQLNESKESGGKQPYQQNRIYSKEGLSPTIDQAAGKWSVNAGYIRRLTEVECERLQGFPDNWTRFGVYEKQVWINKKEGTFEIVQGIREIPRSQRYKLCGNAVTKHIVELIGKKLLA